MGLPLGHRSGPFAELATGATRLAHLIELAEEQEVVMNPAKLALLVIAAGGLAVACGSSCGGNGSGGASGAAGARGAAGATGGTGGGNPVCVGADSHGFFSSCSACTNPGNCDTIDVSGSSRNVAPNVNTCGICLR